MNGEGVGKAHDPYTVYTTKPLELDKGWGVYITTIWWKNWLGMTSWKSQFLHTREWGREHNTHTMHMQHGAIAPRKGALNSREAGWDLEFKYMLANAS
jgi:hypothetical protein